MNLDKIKTISIHEYLAKKEFHPQRRNEVRGIYISPIRKDNNASFSVDFQKNLWYDHGIGKGGSIIDLVSEMENCSISDAIKKLESDSFSFHREAVIYNGKQERPEQLFSILKVKKLGNFALIDYLNERCVDIDTAEKHCCEVYYSINNNRYFAIGFANNSPNSYELRNKYFKSCIGKKDFTYINNGTKRTVLFEGFMDYLSFLSMQEDRHLSSDAIILNSTANTKRVLDLLCKYDEIHSYLDNDQAGSECSLFIQTHCPDSFVDCRKEYSNFKDLNEFLCWKNNEEKLGYLR
ncbi:toprim domain-containing protein [Parabacteroides sp. PF5-9]|uniref:toprim domain-containing protein n=1 Tax=Parabacteroides sp. PF5-9 TaxID=1742404 RepID=UPI0024770015|nr:toprim domain-containing protein [Parabacteroides sp. PF5-9]MDH6356237.1 DNA primase [Parabacteroides sp. PF5-9]